MRNSLPCSYILELVALQIARFAKFFFFLRWASFVCVYVRSLSAINKLHYICINHCVDEKVFFFFSLHSNSTSALRITEFYSNGEWNIECKNTWLRDKAKDKLSSGPIGREETCIFVECKVDEIFYKKISQPLELCSIYFCDVVVVSFHVDLSILPGTFCFAQCRALRNVKRYEWSRISFWRESNVFLNRSTNRWQPWKTQEIEFAE